MASKATCDGFKARFLRRKYCRRCSLPKAAHSALPKGVAEHGALPTAGPAPTEEGNRSEASSVPSSPLGPTPKVIHVAPAARLDRPGVALAASPTPFDKDVAEELRWEQWVHFRKLTN